MQTKKRQVENMVRSQKGPPSPCFPINQYLVSNTICYLLFFSFDFTNMDLYRIFSFVRFFSRLLQDHLVYTFAHGDSQGSSLSYYSDLRILWYKGQSPSDIVSALSRNAVTRCWGVPTVYILLWSVLSRVTAAWLCQLIICELQGTFTCLFLEEGFLPGLQLAS